MVRQVQGRAEHFSLGPGTATRATQGVRASCFQIKNPLYYQGKNKQTKDKKLSLCLSALFPQKPAKQHQKVHSHFTCLSSLSGQSDHLADECERRPVPQQHLRGVTTPRTAQGTAWQPQWLRYCSPPATLHRWCLGGGARASQPWPAAAGHRHSPSCTPGWCQFTCRQVSPSCTTDLCERGGNTASTLHLILSSAWRRGTYFCEIWSIRWEEGIQMAAGQSSLLGTGVPSASQGSPAHGIACPPSCRPMPLAGTKDVSHGNTQIW